MKLVGDALYDSFSIADFAVESSAEAKVYAHKYRATYKTEPDSYSTRRYDSIKLLASASTSTNTIFSRDILAKICDSSFKPLSRVTFPSG